MVADDRRGHDQTSRQFFPPDFLEELKSSYNDRYAFREKIDIEGLDHPGKMFDLAEALIRRGYGDDAIRRILGGNFERVLGEIWSVPSAAGEEIP